MLECDILRIRDANPPTESRRVEAKNLPGHFPGTATPIDRRPQAPPGGEWGEARSQIKIRQRAQSADALSSRIQISDGAEKIAGEEERGATQLEKTWG